MSKEGRYPTLSVARCWVVETDGNRRCVVMTSHNCRLRGRKAVPTVVQGVAAAAILYGALLAVMVAFG